MNGRKAGGNEPGIRGSIRLARNLPTTYVCSLFPGWKVEVGPHFMLRRKERDVRQSEIRQTLEHCDYSHPAREPDEVRIVKKIDDRNFIHIIGLKFEARKTLVLKTVMVLPTGKMMRQ